MKILWTHCALISSEKFNSTRQGYEDWLMPVSEHVYIALRPFLRNALQNLMKVPDAVEDGVFTISYLISKVVFCLSRDK